MTRVESETGRSDFGVGLRRGEQRMDHTFRKSGPRTFDVTPESALDAPTFEDSHSAFVCRDEDGLWPAESITERRGVGGPPFLQRLPKRDFLVWVARAAHHRLRSSGGADCVLHFT